MILASLVDLIALAGRFAGVDAGGTLGRCMERLGVNEAILGSRTGSLSSGQKRRALLLLACLAGRGRRVVIYDESFANLDPQGAALAARVIGELDVNPHTSADLLRILVDGTGGTP